MPKHKKSKSSEKDIDYYRNKIKKFQRKITEQQTSVLSPSKPEEIDLMDEDTGADTPALRPDDWLLHWSDDEIPDNCLDEPQPGPSTVISAEEQVTSDNNVTELDTEALEILGNDPNSSEKLGVEIRNELASRLLHVVKEGLSKENRKELISKYPPPANCYQIDAPKVNAEIKVAISDTALRRDKGIEQKQKQMASAIACLSNIIHTELNSTTRNNVMLQKLMDIGRILCDLQHADSITRRNFITFALKNDMKEHLKNTKIDSFLFGENLAETLKTARAVNKSGVELKADSNKPTNSRYKGAPLRPLNFKAPLQARRPFGVPAPLAPRSRQPAAARYPYAPPPPPPSHPATHAHSSRTLSQTHNAPPAATSSYPQRRRRI